jgi:hypothetical protein
MLRTFFVRLSENRPLRNFAERSSLGQSVSRRFVAGTGISDAIAVTRVKSLEVSLSREEWYRLFETARGRPMP